MSALAQKIHLEYNSCDDKSILKRRPEKALPVIRCDKKLFFYGDKGMFFYVITKFQTVFFSFFPNVLCVCCHFSILFPWCKTHKSVLLVYTEYVFDGVFDVVAESKEEARQKVLQNYGLVMDGSIHSTLPDDEINWAFDRHPNKRIDWITKV